MHKIAIILILVVTINGTQGPKRALCANDKIVHAITGAGIALTTNIILHKMDATRIDGKSLSAFEYALFSALLSGVAGATYEYLNRPADPNDILATFTGGLIVGVFTIIIDF